MEGIEYADTSWNPSSGGSQHGHDDKCAVWRTCWAYKRARMLAGRYGYPPSPDFFKPTFHEDKLVLPYKWKKPRRIDTCFMGDLFSEGVPSEWIKKILKVIKDNPRHRFYLLTKNPQRMSEFRFPDNAWCGVSMNMHNANELGRSLDLREVDAKIKYVSFEPLYSKIDPFLRGIDWVILGAQTRPEYQPKKEWVEYLISLADYYNIPVFMKPNLKIDGIELRQEFPKC